MNKKGFSLVELSVVLIIIGLLVAGVSVGSKLIEQSRIMRYVYAINSLDSSINGFYLKYTGLPGDLSNANDFGLGNNGNGDNVIGSKLDELGNVIAGTGYEYLEPMRNMFTHLEATGLYKKVNLGGFVNIGIDYRNILYLWKSVYIVDQNGNYYWSLLGMLKSSQIQIIPIAGNATFWLTNTQEGFAIFSKILYGIDQKLDDGNAVQGKITISEKFFSNRHISSDCASVSTGVYNIVANGPCVGFYDMPSLAIK